MIDTQYRRPGAIAVAVFAQITALNMIGRLDPSARTAVVAAIAVGGIVFVVEIGRRPGAGRMAHITGVAAGHMTRLLDPAGGAAVMAAVTGAEDVAMVDPGRYPIGVTVAILTQIVGQHMGGIFTRYIRCAAVMTAVAIGCYLAMGEGGRRPGSGRVTEIAAIVARDMSCTLGLP